LNQPPFKDFSAMTPDMLAIFLTLPSNIQKMVEFLWAAGRNSTHFLLKAFTDTEHSARYPTCDGCN
jgi:hypothetical protein